MDYKKLKEKIQQEVKQKISDKINICESKMKSLYESKTADTKSSAGDKFETSRAMIQIEESQVQKQYKEAKDMAAMHVQNLRIITEAVIDLNSLVVANQMIFYISVSLGKLTLEDTTIFCISEKAPIAKRLIGKRIGEHIQLNDQDLEIKEVC